MKRAVLRLVEPLGDPLEFPEGKSESAGTREIAFIDEVHSHLQLFLLWPDYSSAFIKVGGEMVKAKITVDQDLSEFDQLFVQIEEDAFNKVKLAKSAFERVYIEVFGLTFGFNPQIQECIGEFAEGMPCISIELPTTITRYNMRGTRRIRLHEPFSLVLVDKGEVHSANLIDITPNALRIKLIGGDKEVKLSDRVSISDSKNSFDALAVLSKDQSILIKPLIEEAKQFGGFFDLYTKFAYPDLRSRFSFESDPIPELLTKTGQVKNYGAREVSDTWYGEIKEAYQASLEVKDDYVAGYVSVDAKGEPVGTSSLAKVFIDQDGADAWAFHGLGAVQDPSLISNTCSLYKWRVDYILARESKSMIVMWFNSRGKWIEKVYVKFQKLTDDNTELWPIKHNRYFEKENLDFSKNDSYPKWKFKKELKFDKFERYMATDSSASVGLGVPYLNYGGILNNIFFFANASPSDQTKTNILQTISVLRPKRFFIETPQGVEDIQIPNYNMFLADVANRQCFTNVEALRFFSSSLEHSQAVVRKKYGNKSF